MSDCPPTGNRLERTEAAAPVLTDDKGTAIQNVGQTWKANCNGSATALCKGEPKTDSMVTAMDMGSKMTIGDRDKTMTDTPAAKEFSKN